MRATLTVEMDNAAFEEPGRELARILRHLAKRVENQLGDYPAMDANGNKVGELTIWELTIWGED